MSDIAVGRWITQTKFYDPSQPQNVCTGNCTEAALASLFGIKLDEVPSMQGLADSDYWDALDAFVASRGYDLSMQPPSYRPAGLYLADGPSARGCGHFVVMRDGDVVHDPHPSRAGLLRVENVWVLMPLDPATISPPGGYVLAPLEPTRDMLRAGAFVEPPDAHGQEYIEMEGAEQCWRLMLAARPKVTYVGR